MAKTSQQRTLQVLDYLMERPEDGLPNVRRRRQRQRAKMVATPDATPAKENDMVPDDEVQKYY